jgi:hypothetical protein
VNLESQLKETAWSHHFLWRFQPALSALIVRESYARLRGYGVTIALILAGILFNRQDVKDLRSELRQQATETNRKVEGLTQQVSDLRAEMFREFREFYRTLGQHDAKIDALEKKQA